MRLPSLLVAKGVAGAFNSIQDGKSKSWVISFYCFVARHAACQPVGKADRTSLGLDNPARFLFEARLVSNRLISATRAGSIAPPWSCTCSRAASRARPRGRTTDITYSIDWHCRKQDDVRALTKAICDVFGTSPKTTKLLHARVDEWTDEFSEDVYVSIRAKATPDRTREVVSDNMAQIQKAFADHDLVANVRLETYVGDHFFHLPPKIDGN